jgi:formate dehydrogenase subunit delta
MNLQNLIHMANRIGEFFDAMPDRDEAVEGVATHIHRFWEPRMRRELIAAIEAGQAQALVPLVREAVLSHRAALMPRT